MVLLSTRQRRRATQGLSARPTCWKQGGNRDGREGRAGPLVWRKGGPLPSLPPSLMLCRAFNVGMPTAGTYYCCVSCMLVLEHRTRTYRCEHVSEHSCCTYTRFFVVPGLAGGAIILRVMSDLPWPCLSVISKRFYMQDPNYFSMYVDMDAPGIKPRLLLSL